MRTLDGGPAADSPVTPEVARAQLERILASNVFVPSQRLCRFLRFIVERTLAGEVERLKEFVVAVEVFDRDETYDSNIDSIVRVEARRLRAKLKAYYEGPGRDDAILIGLRPGSYVPLFRHLTHALPPLARPTDAGVSNLPSGQTVAVLPFSNLSPEPEQDYFCDGITEEIINALTAMEDLSVVARTSAFQFKGKAADVRSVGERLGARVVVEGSVRKAGNKLRITAQAIDALTGYHLWSETYNRDLEDVFVIQEEISLSIARVLHAKLRSSSLLRAERPSISVQAYAGFLKGMFLKGLVSSHQLGIQGLYTAVEHFRALTHQYPDYAQPHTGVAATLGFLSVFGVVPGRDVLPEMKANAEKAVRLDPSSAEAWSVLAGICAHWDFDWVRSKDCFERAILLQPGNPGPRAWYGMMLAVQGRFSDAEVELEKASRVNPLAAADQTRLAYLHYLRGDDSRASSHLDQAFALEPEFAEARLYRGLVLMRGDQYARAIEVLSRDLDRLPIAIHLGLLVAACAADGRSEEARAWLRRLEDLSAERYVSPQALALAWTGLGDHDRAFESLENGIRDRAMFAPFLSVDPFYDALRADPRFSELLSLQNLGPALR